MAIAGPELTFRDEHRLRRLRDPARRERELAKALERIERRRAAVPERISYPPQLPVSARREDLLAAIRDHQVVVVAGETGSGKTTQLPKLCLELGRGVRGTIAHTQPRRIAARSVAERIAHELHVPLGSTVGYSVRFNDRSGESTLVRLMTDGLLLAEVQHDRELRRYDTIIVDEAHERSLNIDFLLGYLARLLPRRPDLKVIITSATIDPQRFARHFGEDVPVVEVSGRTYPVEVRYRPPEEDDDRDQSEQIADAVGELVREGPGDVLVFLSGEREIRDAADELTGRFGDELDVLPLYARLSSGEQQRVFRTGPRRRVVLATNVAETSLTVPGIRYVVDPGTARMSRYSARLKVQRLPIEPVSQASADQRKGRCGRVSAGICVRLYSEEDLLERPRFTDPEILRTNLASVILQMAALRLGAIEDFPFLDPPDRRQVRDGVNLLVELGALDEGSELTDVGRRLARLPVDPRLGRMVLEADRLGCLREVTVVTAALSIQDPRERPAEQQGAADQAHARFAEEGSDVLALLRLWQYLEEQQRELSGSAFRRRCKAEFLHYLRIREWQDLVGQLRSAAKDVGLRLPRPDTEPAEPAAVHRALLSGLLSHVGLHDRSRREYQGARGVRFALWPGSALARKQPDWVAVAELVETSRLWGRTAFRVQPGWIEPLAEHLVKRTHAEPRWDRRRAQVVATEKVLLYGLPVVAGRTVPYAPIDPVASRELFLRRALVEREWDTKHAFFARNGELLAEVEALEERLRRRGLGADDETLFRFFDERVPETVVSGAHFDRWWKDARRREPDLLTYTQELLLGEDLDAGDRPPVWRQDDLELPLSYAFEPGAEHDGVTVHVPLRLLGRLDGEQLEWLVPAFRLELVTALLRALPKDLRRDLVPVPDTAAAVLGRLRPREEPLLPALSREVEALRGVRVPVEAWDRSRLPSHLRMTVRVEDEAGRLVATGTSLEAVREQVRPRLRAELARAAAGLVRTGEREWAFGDLPKVVALPGTGGAVRGFPALVDEGEAVGVQVLDDPADQARAMRAGTRRLLLLALPSPLRQVRRALPQRSQLALAAAPAGLLGDALTAAVDLVVDDAGGPAWTATGFAKLRAIAAERLPRVTQATVTAALEVLAARADVDLALDGLAGPAFADARRDVAAQLGRLTFPGFVAAHGARRLPELFRYLRAAEERVRRLPANLAVDRDRMRVVHELEALHATLPARVPEVTWALEELRVAMFAPSVEAHGAPSARKVRKLIDARRTAARPAA